jgi:hypothetical protein
MPKYVDNQSFIIRYSLPACRQRQVQYSLFICSMPFPASLQAKNFFLFYLIFTGDAFMMAVPSK